jgi:hypothetical protein
MDTSNDRRGAWLWRTSHSEKIVGIKFRLKAARENAKDNQ